jgi:hypothetical protein
MAMAEGSDAGQYSPAISHHQASARVRCEHLRRVLEVPERFDPAGLVELPEMDLLLIDAPAGLLHDEVDVDERGDVTVVDEERRGLDARRSICCRFSKNVGSAALPFTGACHGTSLRATLNAHSVSGLTLSTMAGMLPRPNAA